MRRDRRSAIAPRSAGLTPDQERELRETARLFEGVLVANANDLSALEALRELYERLGEGEKADATLERIVALTPSGAAESRPPRRGPTPPRSLPVAEPHASFGAAPAPVAAAPVSFPPRPASPLRASAVNRASVTQPAARRFAGARDKNAVRARSGRIGDLLVADGLISPTQLAEALREQRVSRARIGEILVVRGLITEEQLVAFLSRQHGIPLVALPGSPVPPDVLALVPEHVARRHDVLPLMRTPTALTLAMADPTDVFVMDEIALRAGVEILPVIATPGGIRRAIEQNYARLSEADVASLNAILAEISRDASQLEVVENDEASQGNVNVFELKESADEAPVVKLVNMVLLDAIRKGASDLHWEPYEKVFRIRFRIDGVLHEMIAPPKRLEPAILSRLKIMSNLDISERRLPQDGRIKLRYGIREIDFRVSILPTIFGEKAVLRILDKDNLQLDLTKLGFDSWAMDKFTSAIRQPYGMVLITGPTGSGKTTTLYSAIHTINSPEHNIMTAEDPVEYNLKGVNQVQINDGVGRTFSAALRSFLRQDPDIILVGETRDLETAQISIRAALTGHLVFSTLHTNDSPSTIARLIDMGIPPFLVASSLLLVMAQRLGRKVCKDCKEPYEVD